MKLVWPAAVLLTCRNAAAFVGYAGKATSRPHQQRQQQRTHDTCTSSVRGTRCRHLSCPAQPWMSMSAAGRENDAEAGDGSNGTEEEAARKDGSNAADGADAGAAVVEASAADGAIDDGVQSGQGAAAEEDKGPVKKKEAEGEEEDKEGDTVFLPTGDNKDFRLFRAKLRAGSDEKWKEQLRRNVNVGQLAGQDAWAHELSAPEKGCLIVAKSTQFSMAQTYFNEAVIFLASYDEAGSAGFILNRPTSVQLGDLVEGNALRQFQKTPLYLGGDVGEGNVQILHPFGPEKLTDSMEIIPGVYIGGAVDEADRMVASGRAKVDDFKFMLHLCGWAPGQLEDEIQRGVWMPVATSTNVILKHCLSLPVPMWREVMTLMGPKYGLLARDTYDDL
ncbi:conserved unknown protein [Ectocarpus siliculosus]|uniref:Transcriptional regulator n=1 Tax=Ectocarpus siliculosus TaxID=2880 RepID=D7G408_ECTSI|nr:conserved unknown protein [Ectocarpus siliculosus]|eukprot:CBJ27043.1 conserved unknown protein [Ectocarpus siliculosus]